MKWIIGVGDKNIEVELISKQRASFIFRVGDREIKVELPDNLKRSNELLIDGKLVNLKYLYNFHNELAKVLVKDLAIPVKISKPTIERPKVEEKDISKAVVKTELAGKVLKILKDEGEKVKKGEVVIIFESMKMENEITSPIDGVVTSINVEEGDSVLAGYNLFVVEK